MHSTAAIPEAPAAIGADTAVTNGTPAVDDATATAFHEALHTATTAVSTPEPPLHTPMDGDLDGNGVLSDGEKFILQLRAAIKELQATLVMLATDNRLTENQRQRLTAGMKALGQLVSNATSALQNHESIDLKQLRAQATEIMLAATSTDSPGTNPVPHPPSREEDKAHDALATRLLGRAQRFLAA